MSALMINQERCKACNFCIVNCKNKALQIGDKSNKKGYRYVVNDPELCNACGICYIVCPDIVFSITE